MYNNRTLQNKVLNGCNNYYMPKGYSPAIRYLTSCEILNEYINNPCSIFNGTIVPTGAMPPDPPIPPVPPVTPGVIDNFGQFLAPTASLTDGNPFIFNNIEIKGDAILHVDGSPVIILAPNRNYLYAWISEIEVFTPDVVTAGAVLVIDGVDVPGSTRTFTGPGNLGVRELEAIGRFRTGNAEQFLNLIYLTSNSLVNNRVNATLTIVEETP